MRTTHPVAFGSVPGISFRTTERDEGRSTQARSSLAPAAFDGRQARATHVVLFVEPETRQGRPHRALARDGIASIPADVSPTSPPHLRGMVTGEKRRAAVQRAAQRVIHTLTGGVDPSVVSDELSFAQSRTLHSRAPRPSLTLEDGATLRAFHPAGSPPLRGADGECARPYILWSGSCTSGTSHGRRVALDGCALAGALRDPAHLSRTRARCRFSSVGDADAGPLRPALIGTVSRGAALHATQRDTTRTLRPCVRSRADPQAAASHPYVQRRSRCVQEPRTSRR